MQLQLLDTRRGETRASLTCEMQIKFVQRNANRTCGGTAAATHRWSHREPLDIG
jgi:hypothetical protein